MINFININKKLIKSKKQKKTIIYYIIYQKNYRINNYFNR